MQSNVNKGMVAVCVVALTAAVAASQLPEKTRVIPFGLRSVAERLLPDDQIVVLARDDSDQRVIEREPTPSAAAKALVQGNFGNVALVDVSSVRGVLVDDGRWIDTQFEGVLVQAVSSQETGKRILPSKGDLLSFSFDGGELKIGSVTVRTHNAMRFPIGQRYLVFLGPPVPWGTSTMVAGIEPLLVEGDRLKPVGSNRPPISSLRLRDVLQIARQ